MSRKIILRERQILPRLRQQSARKSNSTLRSRGSRYAWLFLTPSLVGVMIFVGLPFLDVVRRSFFDAMGNRFTGIKNYSIVWSNQAFRLAVSNTARFLAVCIALLLAVSFGLALLVYRGDTRHGVFKTSLVLPMAIPVASVVLVWKMIFCPDGILNQFLTGVSGTVWELDWVMKETSFGVLAATYLWKNAGYDMLLWLAGMSAIPESLYEAARVDGAGSLDHLRYITIPMLKGTFGMVLILSVVNSFRVYREAYLLAGSYPPDSIYLLPHLFGHWFLKLDVQKMSTAAVMMTVVTVVPVLLAIGIARSRIRRNMG